MKIGIGGGIGPFRGGISTRGLGIGVGPLHASSGWGRRRRRGSSSGSGCLTVFGFVIVVALVFWLIAWPYYLGTWLAVQLGADLHSTGRAVTGWVFEILAVFLALTLLVVSASRANGRRQEQERRASWKKAVERRDLLSAQLHQLDSTLNVLAAHPLGSPDTRVKAREKLLVAFSGAELMEPRSAYRGGPRVPTPVDSGTVAVTDTATRFQGSTKNVEWRYDKMVERRLEDGAAIFTVTNRQMVSGVRAADIDRQSLHMAIDWGAALSGGAGPAAARVQAETVRAAMVQALARAEDEVRAKADTLSPSDPGRPTRQGRG